ncbi:AraC family transcriptional regulator [Streptomyces tateyamensis]|uniref:AraC family transcriptional regulator n=1 Tax=Streptomyces tateyamensis TaxID=565073 RepID=A0A2V4NNA0_9ACTN|nr:AraC family transcriptional regulator [Streptomyces tateyamensis]PYC77217.1 AraC family transcriptional regulator [Streptomyces tateyamensis]
MTGADVEVARVGNRWRVSRPWHPGLRPYLRSYAGYFETTPAPYQVRVVPSGRAVLVLNLAAPFSRVERMGVAGGSSGRIGSLVVGLEDRPALLEHPGGQEAIRVEFSPLGAYRLFGLPMRELTNRAVELTDVLGPGGGRLVERLAATADWRSRFDLLDGALLARVAGGPEPAAEVRRAWQLLVRSGGSLPIAAIAAEVGWSHGYLVRRCTEQVGLAPKASARVLRFHRAVAMLGRGDRKLVDTALACGYADQAHLSREFRVLAGVSPARLQAARRAEGALTV